MEKVNLVDFNRFKKIMETLLAFRDKRERVSDFFEKELTEDSWCIFTYGNDIESTLIHMLADEFNCWYYISRTGDPENYSPKHWWETKYPEGDNDISYWLYELDDEDKKMIVDDEEIPVNTLEEFYSYLVKYYK